MDPITPTPYSPTPSEVVYTDLSTAVATIQAHAKANRYTLFQRDAQPPHGAPTQVVYTCDRARKH